LEKTN